MSFLSENTTNVGRHSNFEGNKKLIQLYRRVGGKHIQDLQVMSLVVSPKNKGKQDKKRFGAPTVVIESMVTKIVSTVQEKHGVAITEVKTARNCKRFGFF
jgi:hypothetical protein